MIVFLDNIDGIEPEQIGGFFVGWKSPLSAEQLLQILHNSYAVEVAYDDQTDQVVGFVNALSDQVNFAFIPMLEVLPFYQHRGIGTQLMKRVLAKLEHITCIDLTCKSSLQPFYQQFDMMPSIGMVIRRYLK
jgi:ribosomal protein S18 acetylase RimI-like enzyme